MRFQAVRIWSLAALLALVLASACAASVPSLMSYQGKLTNASGGAVTDGEYAVTFSLFTQPSSGIAVWTEARTVQTLGGVFTVLLGSLNLLPESAFAGESWLETAVGGTTLSPRIQLVTAGYAQMASVAESVPDYSITSAKMPAGVITEDKLGANSVISDRLAAEAVTTPIIADGAVTLSKIAPGVFNQVLRSSECVFNVKDYGAMGNGIANDTAAFQAALDAAGAAHGGVVIVPTGKFKIATHLNVPSNVTLEGIFNGPPRMVGWQDVSPMKGSMLLASEGEGSTTGTPFITLNQNSGLKGLIIYYPNQTVALPTPLAYPYTIQATNVSNTSVIDLQIVNTYQCFNVDGGGGHYIRGLYGQALYRGVVVDNCSSMSIENAHIFPFNNAFADAGQNLWQTTNGISFIFKKCDWLQMTNVFVLGYAIGVQFAAGANGTTHGSVLGLGCDGCSVDVQVDACSPAGLQFTNGEFVPTQDPQKVGFNVGPNVGSGAVRLSNCAFWGGNNRIARIQSGTVTFTNCMLSDFQSANYAIYSTGGTVNVRNCFFRSSGNGVWAGAGTTSCIIMGNQGLSSGEIRNDIGTACVSASNKS